MGRKLKKGAIEVQFSWIFILIAGALIIAFFFLIVQKQKVIADTKLSGTIKADLSTILAGSQVSRGTSSLVEIPEVEINYDCEGYAVGNLEAINPGISFSPDLLKGTQLMMWSLDWNMPFRVDNFLFITSPQIRYLFEINNAADTRFNDIYNSTDKPSFPPRTIVQDGENRLLISKELVVRTTLNAIQNINSYKYRFVFKNDEWLGMSIALFFRDLPGESVTAVSIFPDASCSSNSFDCYGILRFYEKGKKMSANERNLQISRGPDTYYLGRASLIAGIFSENPDLYNCQMQKAFKKLKFIAQVYIDKVDALSKYYSDPAINNVNCQIISSAVAYLIIIRDNADATSNNFPGAGIIPIQNIYSAIPQLEELNNELQRMSCAEIY